MELQLVAIAKPSPDINVIIGQSHFVKTVEDLYEAIVQAVPGIKFGVAFNEASGPRLVRHKGTDPELERAAVGAAEAIATGHNGSAGISKSTLRRRKSSMKIFIM
jgi:hypothetical protein